MCEKNSRMNHPVRLSRCFGKPLVKYSIKCNASFAKYNTEFVARAHAVKVAYMSNLDDLQTCNLDVAMDTDVFRARS